MTLPVDASRCYKSRINLAAGHYCICHEPKGHDGLHKCLCGAEFRTLIEEAREKPGD